MDYEYEGFVSSSDESIDSELLVLYLIMRRRKRRTERRFWVHPVWRRRREQGAHGNLYREMVMTNPLMFRQYLRITVIQYENLLLKLGPSLISAPTRKDVISPSEKLILTLRYLATGETFFSLQGQFRIGVSTIHRIVFKVLQSIWNTLQPDVLKMPYSAEKWQKIINEFHKKWQFPHCWGAMDEKQVVIEAEPHSGSINFNYKHQHSLNLLALCDAKYRYIR